jgi:uncharacterized protein YhaN
VEVRAKELHRHERRTVTIELELKRAREAIEVALPDLKLAAGATSKVARARLQEFAALQNAQRQLKEAVARRDAEQEVLAGYQSAADDIADKLQEVRPDVKSQAIHTWKQRLLEAVKLQREKELGEAALAKAREDAVRCRNKVALAEATLRQLCTEAGVDAVQELVAAEEASSQKRTAQRDLELARKNLTDSSRKDRATLIELLVGRDMEALDEEEQALTERMGELENQLQSARSVEESARHALDAVDDSDAAAQASNAAASAASTVMQLLPLQRRTRLAHALLGEAVRRFKERTEAPMLKAASLHFSSMTDGEFSALVSDDSGDKQSIVGRRKDGSLVPVQGMSEGTRDQLYLSLRLAALEMQRSRGVELPLILDDVLMTSDDVRARHMLKALASFSRGGQIIVFTHHEHLCEIARNSVDSSCLAVSMLAR